MIKGGKMLEKYFEYKKHKTNFKTEVIAGVTTFLTMAYIMFLNPFILSGEFDGPEFDVKRVTSRSEQGATEPLERRLSGRSLCARS